MRGFLFQFRRNALAHFFLCAGILAFLSACGPKVVPAKSKAALLSRQAASRGVTGGADGTDDGETGGSQPDGGGTNGGTVGSTDVGTVDGGSNGGVDGSTDGSSEPTPTPVPVRKLEPKLHPRLYYFPEDKSSLAAKVNRVPILGSPVYKESYVNGFLLNKSAWQGARFYAGLANSLGCVNPDTIGTQLGGNAVASSRDISDCITTTAIGSVFETDPTIELKLRRAAIDGMMKMATVWPQSGTSYAGFGRWTCGSCGAGTNLSNGELLYSTAVAYDLLYALMSAAEQKAIRDLLIREVRYIYTNSYDPATWWSKNTANNWQAVINGGMGIAALVLKGEPGVSDQEADQWIARANEQITTYLGTNFDEDGANFEDIGHFHYGLSFATNYFYAQKRVLGVDYFRSKKSAMYKALMYLVQTVEPTLDRVMPNDAGTGYTTYPTYLLLASEFREGTAQWLWESLSGSLRPAANSFPFKVSGSGCQSQLLQTALGYDDTVKPVSPNGKLPLGKVFASMGRSASRSAWDDPNALFLGTDAGIYGSHGQPDQGHFFLTAYGKHFLDQKNPTDTSVNFNVAMVDGSEQKTTSYWKAVYSNTLSHFVSPLLDYVEYDTKPAYTQTLDRANREFLFIRPTSTHGGYVVVMDRFAAQQAHVYQANFHSGLATPVTTVVGSSGSEIFKTTEGDRTLYLLSAGSATLTKATDSFLKSVTPSLKQADFMTLLYPTMPGQGLVQGEWFEKVESSALHGFRIGPDSILARTASGLLMDGNLSTDGDLVFYRKEGNSYLALGAMHATQIKANNVQYVSSNLPITFVVSGSSTVKDYYIGRMVRSDNVTTANVKLVAPAVSKSFQCSLNGVASSCKSDAAGMVSFSALDLTQPVSIEIK